jgi:hypothetical protein
MAPLGTVRSRRLVKWVCALACALGTSAAAHADEVSLEAAVKAAYVYKFAPFVTWPGSRSGTFTICTLGSDTVSALLPRVTAGQQVQGRAIRVTPARQDDLDSCEILYIAGDAELAPEMVRGKPILTISNAPRQGIIELVTVAKHVRFDIDTRLATNSGLAISSKLLELARSVTPRPPT